MTSLITLTLMGGGREEPGWRGFALPRMLQRWSPLKASVLLGLLWAAWHLPLFVFVPDYDNALVAMLAHGSVNAGMAFAPTTALPTATAFLAVGLVALAVGLATRGRRGAS